MAAGAAEGAPEGRPADVRFKVEKLVEGMPQPMAMQLAPDGRLWFNEIGGKLKAYDFKTKAVEVIGEIPVYTKGENGFLAFLLDQRFAETGWVYVIYSPLGEAMQYLARFTVRDGKLDRASEKLILKYEENRTDCCHHGATLAWGKDGCLLWSAGDNTNPFGDSQGYSPADERPGRETFNGQLRPGNTMSLAGKINRIRVKPDATYEIPEGNLFPPGTPRTRPEIFVMGNRNPWRMSVDPVTGYVYWGEVGPDANNDGPRGSRGYDEINQARKAGNFGWPYFVGPNAPYAKVDFATGKVGAKHDPAKPLNEAPGNPGLRELPPAQGAFIWWPYGRSDKWPELGSGGRTACAGPVFRWKPEFEQTGGFPRYFDNCLLFWDWQRPFIKWARLDGDSNLVRIEAFADGAVACGGKAAPGAVVVRRPSYAFFGPDGHLFLMDYGATWGANKDSAIYRISYVRGALPPTLAMAVTPAHGKAPLELAMSAAGSRDPEGGKLSHTWRLLPEGRKLGEGESLKARLDKPGVVSVELTTRSEAGGEARQLAQVVVGNTPPEVRFSKPAAVFADPGAKLAYEVVAKDAEEGEAGLAARATVTVRIGSGEEAEAPGLALMRQTTCFNCHATDAPLIGPAFTAVAERYRGQKGAADKLVEKVRKGGAGVWGPVPMLAHPQHTDDEVALMMRWVLALEPGKSGTRVNRGLAGEVTVPADGSAVTLVASVTDGGAAAGAEGALTGTATLRLRPRQVEAESAEVVDGPRTLDGNSAGGRKFLGGVNDGHAATFREVPLGDVKRIRMRTASAGTGGKVEVRLGGKGGKLLGTLGVPVTGGWEKWQEGVVELPAGLGVSDVTLVFVNPGKGALMNLDWVRFEAQAGK